MGASTVREPPCRLTAAALLPLASKMKPNTLAAFTGNLHTASTQQQRQCAVKCRELHEVHEVMGEEGEEGEEAGGAAHRRSF